jgi:hypothetical protein
MIITQDLIEYLKKNILESSYIETKYFTYNSKCIAKLSALKNSNNNRSKIPRVGIYLEPLRKFILNNPTNFTIFISKNKYKNVSYVKFKLTDFELNNLFELLELNEKYNSNILDINKITSESIKELLSRLVFKKLNDLNYVYLHIINKKNLNIPNKISKSIYKISSYYDSLGLLLGIESINLLKYQRLDRIKNFIENNPEGKKVYSILQSYNDAIHSLSFEERDMMIIHSGAIFEALGTTYTRDVDIIKLDFKSNLNDIKIYLKNQNKDFDFSIMDSKLNFYTGNNAKHYKYKTQWILYDLPQLIGAKDIFEIISNPRYYFYFAGIKFSSLELNIAKFLHRSSISSMADLIMLSDINNYDIKNRLCLPNLTIRQGRLVVFYGEYLNKWFNDVKKALKEYYNADYSVEELKKIITFCGEKLHDIYTGNMVIDPDTNIIKYFHLTIKEEIFKKYTLNTNYLLDIGSGKLTDMKFWDKFNVKHVVGIEPSKDSIKMGNEKIQKHGFKGQIDIINGVGDEDWSLNKIYDKVLENKYDVITIQFVFHYMMNNLDTVIRNLKSVMNLRTKIIITCMDGNLIQNDFLRYSSRIEIRNDQEPIFAIVPRYEVKNNIIPDSNNNILVYFKGAYGVSSGSIEPIIDINKLITIFAQNKIKLLERKKFTDYYTNIRRKMSNIQLKVSNYYMVLVFENEE